MKHIVFAISALALLLSPTSVRAQDAGAQAGANSRRVALIIGNSNYATVPKLANPGHDAAAVAAGVQSVGFSVSTIYDAGRDGLVTALRTFAVRADTSDWALIYFAGHGIEVGGTNYLIPVDARLGSDRDVDAEAISLDQIMKYVEGAKKLRIVVLDACRENPFIAKMARKDASRSVGRGLARFEPAAGSLVVYAAKEGQLALDSPPFTNGYSANSPFAAAFLKNLKTPLIDVRRLFDLIRDDVMEMTGRRQQPFAYYSITGREEFYFNNQGSNFGLDTKPGAQETWNAKPRVQEPNKPPQTALHVPTSMESRDAIKIGYGISLTGGLAPNGKSALLAHKIWQEDINAKGGLLGRPLKLVYYDDQSNAATVADLYKKLFDLDKVDLIIGGYGTNVLAPALPVVMQKKKLLIGLLGLTVNSEFHYPNYFAMTPSGLAPDRAFTKGFFDVALAQSPKPQTVAIIAADAEFSIKVAHGARENARAAGLTSVYDRKYPLNTTDFVTIVRALAAASPDLVVICSYPADSVGMVRAINEVGFKPKMVGGGMVGLQTTALKTLLGPLLNGFVNYDFWLPVPKLNFPGVGEFVQKYQARAPAEGVDPLGYYVGPWGYAQLQILQQAISQTQSLSDDRLATYIRNSTIKTIVGDVKFGMDGEWAQSRVVQAQFQNVKGNGVGQFKDLSTQVVVAPREYESGRVIYPYEKAK